MPKLVFSTKHRREPTRLYLHELVKPTGFWYYRVQLFAVMGLTQEVRGKLLGANILGHPCFMHADKSVGGLLEPICPSETSLTTNMNSAMPIVNKLRPLQYHSKTKGIYD
jgi:hypothetical protein